VVAQVIQACWSCCGSSVAAAVRRTLPSIRQCRTPPARNLEEHLSGRTQADPVDAAKGFEWARFIEACRRMSRSRLMGSVGAGGWAIAWLM